MWCKSVTTGQCVGVIHLLGENLVTVAVCKYYTSPPRRRRDYIIFYYHLYTLMQLKNVLSKKKKTKNGFSNTGASSRILFDIRSIPSRTLQQCVFIFFPPPKTSRRSPSTPSDRAIGPVIIYLFAWSRNREYVHGGNSKRDIILNVLSGKKRKKKVRFSARSFVPSFPVTRGNSTVVPSFSLLHGAGENPKRWKKRNVSTTISTIHFERG